MTVRSSSVNMPNSSTIYSTTLRTSMSTSFIDGSSLKLGKANFMMKRQAYQVIVDGIDYTPDNIVDPDFVTMDDYFVHAAFETRMKPKSESRIVIKDSKSRSINNAAPGTGATVYATTINLDDIHIDYTQNTEEGIAAPDDAALDVPPSAYYLPKMCTLTSYPPEIFIVLKETETEFLFELPCATYEKNTPEATAIEADNELYQYITVGKGRNRKMVTQETQTLPTMFNTRHTLATRPRKKNASTFASAWDMHDTYTKIAEYKSEEEEDEMVLYQSAAPGLLRKKKKCKISVKEDTFNANTREFHHAALLTQRVLASMEYSKEQKKFRGLIRMDPLSLDLKYIYTMKPLWILECGETRGRTITCLCFNPKNEDILAVGYGKFGYAENTDGLVCVWCTKNPCMPERSYKFKEPLTSLAFSDTNPSWLACGFSNGDVIIIDIESFTIKTLAASTRDTNPCFEPIWVTSWRALESDFQYVMTTCQDGRINKFFSTKTHDFICTPMMRLSAVEGQLKGIDLTKQCLKEDVPITRYPAALCMQWLPGDEHQYLVGTDEGCIHRCSTHYLNQHMDVFRAHAGPVYSIQVSPFVPTLLATCGADGTIRFWSEGIEEVIMTLTCNSAVYGVAFCPINSTIILSISGNILSVWDLRRKTHIPSAEFTFQNDVVLMYIKFSTSGDNVFVGDSVGRVYTFHLEDTPIPPFYQRKLLDEALRKVLCTRPHLLKQLDKTENMRAKKGL